MRRLFISRVHLSIKVGTILSLRVNCFSYFNSLDVALILRAVPENLLLTHRGPDAEVKIIDFGLSKILSGSMAKSFLGTRVGAQPLILVKDIRRSTWFC